MVRTNLLSRLESTNPKNFPIADWERSLGPCFLRFPGGTAPEKHGVQAFALPPRQVRGGRKGLNRGRMGQANPNEPKRLNLFVLSKIAHDREKRTHGCYLEWRQSLAAILPPLLGKIVWTASALSRIRRPWALVAAKPASTSECFGALERVAAAHWSRPSLQGVTTKPTMCFRMNGIALNVPGYRRLGSSQRGQGYPGQAGKADGAKPDPGGLGLIGWPCRGRARGERDKPPHHPGPR
jgi:hypothetical protein